MNKRDIINKKIKLKESYDQLNNCKLILESEVFDLQSLKEHKISSYTINICEYNISKIINEFKSVLTNM